MVSKIDESRPKSANRVRDRRITSEIGESSPEINELPSIFEIQSVPFSATIRGICYIARDVDLFGSADLLVSSVRIPQI